jgi:hypothetical protein
MQPALLRQEAPTDHVSSTLSKKKVKQFEQFERTCSGYRHRMFRDFARKELRDAPVCSALSVHIQEFCK